MARGILFFVLTWLAVFSLLSLATTANVKDWIWFARQAAKAGAVTAVALGIVLVVVLFF